MKIEKFNKEYFIFINKKYIGDIDYSDKKSIGEFVKDFIFKLRIKLNLNGFYKVKVYSNEYVGLFLEISCLEENDYPNTLDLRVLVYLNQDVYFCCDDYFIVSNFGNIYYFDNKFYCFVDRELDVSILEFGEFVYNFKNQGIIINKKRIN